MNCPLKHFALFLLSISLAGFSQQGLRRYERLRGEFDKQAEVLYLPNGKGLDLISLGFRNAFANLLWFNSVSYFGKHHRSDQKYPWLNHMCDIITTLDPGMKHVYEFGALMLAWEIGNAEAANRLLTKGISYHPDYWKFYYFRGFNSLYYLHKPVWAQKDFERSANLPEAHVTLKLLAARGLITEMGNPEAAVRFLTTMLAQTEQQFEREILLDRLNEARLALDLKLLSEAISIFEKRYAYRPKKIEELIEKGVVAKLSLDPYGGTYYIDEKTLDPQSSSPQAKKKVK